jgi:8-oxo-dGTP diphosphatase
MMELPSRQPKPRRVRVSAYALLQDHGRILLCRLSEEVSGWSGYWTLPGGGLEFGESPEEALVREVREETGLEIEASSVAAVDSIVVQGEDEEVQAVRLVYHAAIIGGDLRHEVGESTDRCEWHGLDAASDLPLVPLAERGIRILPDAGIVGVLRK